MNDKIPNYYEMDPTLPRRRRRRLTFCWRLVIVLAALATGCFWMESKLESATTVDHASFALMWATLGALFVIFGGVVIVIAWLVTGRVR